MPKNTMTDLRNHLFSALEGLADQEKPMEVDRARAIVTVSKAIIDSAKVEVQFLEVTGAMPTQEFFTGPNRALPAGPKPNGKEHRA